MNPSLPPSDPRSAPWGWIAFAIAMLVFLSLWVAKHFGTPKAPKMTEVATIPPAPPPPSPQQKDELQRQQQQVVNQAAEKAKDQVVQQRADSEKLLSKPDDLNGYLKDTGEMLDKESKKL